MTHETLLCLPAWPRCAGKQLNSSFNLLGWPRRVAHGTCTKGFDVGRRDRDQQGLSRDPQGSSRPSPCCMFQSIQLYPKYPEIFSASTELSSALQQIHLLGCHGNSPTVSTPTEPQVAKNGELWQPIQLTTGVLTGLDGRGWGQLPAKYPRSH
uniref:Uncharacterized protein n=1 Tax=Meleagris gallopavo TaxID=9103 RepID=A0A803XML4_MELGA